MMTCDGKTMVVEGDYSGDIVEQWLAMTVSTRTAYNDIIDKLDRIGMLSNHDGKTLTVKLWDLGDEPVDDVLAWLAMTAATKKAWDKVFDKMHPDGVWARWGS